MIKSKRKVNKEEIIQSSLAIGDLRKGMETIRVREGTRFRVVQSRHLNHVWHGFPDGTEVYLVKPEGSYVEVCNDVFGYSQTLHCTQVVRIK